MRFRMKLGRFWGLVAGAGALVATALPALAESPSGSLAPSLLPSAQAPPTTGQQPGPQAPVTGENQAGQQAETEAPTAPPSAGSSLALGGGSFSATGYIDSAIPVTMFRLRFDAAYDDNSPDRAEFFYAKCGCFHTPDAHGPARPETRIDYQDISSYLEVAFSDRFSAFAEVPVRFLNPEQNENTAGLADMNAGFKYALIACDDHFLTFQFRTYIPTGASTHGLGTDHVSLEPAILAHERLSERLALDAELRDWIPVGGSDFAGNIVRYGVGLSYLVLNRQNFRVIPVGEIVGWTVLDGMQFSPVDNGGMPEDASGDTIVNAKVGVRFGFGDLQEAGLLSRSDLYVGYGRALTGDVWYKDILRVEYRIRF